MAPYANMSYMNGNFEGTLIVESLTSLGSAELHTYPFTGEAPIPTGGPTPGLACSVDMDSPVVCFGEANGVATVSVTGGVEPYSYAWDNGETTATATALDAGAHDVTVTDANGAETTCSVTMQAPAELIVSPTVVQPTCNGDLGSISIEVSGGVEPYSYLWSNGETSATISNLEADVYALTVTDANGCTSGGQYSIDAAPSAITIASAVIPVDCDTQKGAISLTVSGGVPDYTFEWRTSDGAGIVQGEKDQTNLSSGTYVVAVYDANQCMSVKEFVLAEPDCQVSPISITLIDCQIKCRDGKGSIQSKVSGGQAPYTYAWSNGSTDADIYHLSPGTYTVTVTDANGKTASQSSTIQEAPAAITVKTVLTPVACDTKVGGIALTVCGGNAPYQYHWSTTDGSGIEQCKATQQKLTAGTYLVKITDANGCSKEEQIQLEEAVCAEPLCIKLTACQIKCHDEKGSIKSKVSGGVAPYTFQWSNGETGADVYNLDPGTYTVTVTDANGKSDTHSATIDAAPTAIKVTAEVVHATENMNDGSIALIVSGGTAPYTYLWCTGETTKDIEALKPMVYFVDITDSNGCTFRLYRVVKCDVNTAVDGSLAVAPVEIEVYPNPARAIVNFNVSSETPTEATLEIYNLAGAKIAIPFNGNLEAQKTYNVTYDATSIPSGSILIYQLKTGDRVVTGKIFKK